MGGGPAPTLRNSADKSNQLTEGAGIKAVAEHNWRSKQSLQEPTIDSMKAQKEEIAEHFCQNTMIQFIRTKQMYVVSQSPTRVHLFLQEVGSSSSSRLSVAPVIVGDLCCLSDRLLACLPCRKSRSPEAKLETKIGEWTLARLGRATHPPTHD